MRRKISLIHLAIALLCSSCTDRDAINFEREHNVSLPVEIGEVKSRAGGGLSVLNPVEYDLRYILEVFQEETFVKRIVKTTPNFEGTNLDVRLLEGDYQFVIWADFIKEGTSENIHYDTSSLRSISIKMDNYASNDDSKDAYFTPAIHIKVNNNTSVPDIKLSRPLAKVIFVNKGLDNQYINPINVKYDSAVPTTFDAYNGVASGENTEIEYVSIPHSDYNTTDKSQTIISDWLFVKSVSYPNILDCTVTSESNGSKKLSNIEIKRGIRTIIAGNILSTL